MNKKETLPQASAKYASKVTQDKNIQKIIEEAYKAGAYWEISQIYG